MKGSGGYYPPSQRSVYYNYYDGYEQIPDGMNMSQVNGDGYPQLSLIDNARAAIAYHSAASDFIIYAEDRFQGWGIFDYFDPPDMLGYRCYWPYIAVSRNNDIHIIMMENRPNSGDPHILGYTKSKNGGDDWSSLVAVDTLLDLSYMITASPVSDKTAIVYAHPLSRFESQLKNDIYYIESDNGIWWDWDDGKVNVTEYGRFADSLFAYVDLDAIYDYNDNLHIIWNAQWLSDNSYLPTTFLYHYDNGSGTITEMSRSDSTWDTDCELGAKNRPMCKMSMAVQEETGTLFAVYTVFSPDDCSAGGYANGEIYMQYSMDDGLSWSSPQNLTNFPSPGCQPPDCDSDHWPSVADKANEYLHIVFINDKDAGSIVHSEGVVTENLVLYMPVNVGILAVDDGGQTPSRFTLAQNYPNPFNAKTTIEFELLEDSDINLAIYDITGALVEVLHDGYLDSGKQFIVWNAEDVASGAYFYKLATTDGSRVRKMVLLK